jgi:hypothetical protein
MAFQDDILNRFFHGGLLVDENIHDKNMEEFLVENEKKLEEFTNQHIKKIEFLKKAS